jgi:hypothetical protein
LALEKNADIKVALLEVEKSEERLEKQKAVYFQN